MKLEVEDFAQEDVMYQYKFFINYSFTKILFGFTYEKQFAFCVYLIWFKFGVGLMEDAKGFGIWREG